MPVNPTLEAILAEMQGFRADYNSIAENTNSALAQLHADNTALLTVQEASFELLNSLLFQTTRIQEWDLRTYHEAWRNEQSTYLAATDNNVDQIKTLMANFIAPMLENIFYAVNTQVAGSAVLSGCYDCDRPALGPPALDIARPELDIHCQRVQFYLTNISNGWSNVLAYYSAGVPLTAGAAEVLLASGVIPGLGALTIPTGVITGLIGLLGAVWAVKLQRILDLLEDNYDELVQLLYDAESPGAATAAWNDFGNAHFNGITELDLRLLWNIFGSFLFMNALYDATTYPWDSEGYDDTICAPDSGLYTTLVTVQALVAELETPGGTATRTEEARYWLYQGGSVCDGVPLNSYGWCLDAATFVEGVDMNDQTQVVGWCESNFAAVRVRIASSDGPVTIDDNGDTIHTLSSSWYELNTSIGIGYRIVSGVGDGTFVLQAQRFHLGEWTSLY